MTDSIANETTTTPTLSPSDFPSFSIPNSRPTTVIKAVPTVPIAAVFGVVIAVFVLLIAILLVIRKVLKNKGVVGREWLLECQSYCCTDTNVKLPSCSENCLVMAERMDCSVPSYQVWLDSVCPSKQECSMTCSKIWSCYCCLLLAGACEDIQFCPSCSAMECPDCTCCGDCCHCSLRVPECSHVTCLCFECGKAS